MVFNGGTNCYYLPYILYCWEKQLGFNSPNFLVYLDASLLSKNLFISIINSGTEPMPITIILMGITFNGINSYLQARWIYSFSPAYTFSWLFNPLFIAGIIIFISGFIINMHSDYIIRELRKPRETEYKIPYGGMFRYVSCPSYFGEITEWVGWAIMTWSFPGLVFAVWTFANLAPRARSNHLWYINNFADYPKKRKSLIPFVF